ncbi:MAG TPA: DEDD exonuclease domain-containing protein [Actinomycetes bacterium]|nr:DEDD exonuclease domain-containing protein [Actinomycetes bacterium]
MHLQPRWSELTPASTAAGTTSARQATFDELGTPLPEATFVVVDLETTGGSPAGAEITEIGAVKVRGGQVLAEFQTLVRPSLPIPPFIAVLTGITDAMVAGAPRLETVVPAFLEFLGDAVVVAHNAPFDVSFLQTACTRTGHTWPANPIVDTVRLARQVVTRDEAPNCKLSSLAVLFRAETTPDHRALSDARATVDVLHGLIGRLGNLGVHSVEELTTYSSTVPAATRRKRHLAESLPRTPGVYVFEDADGQALYIGKATNLRARVRSYFTASEPRARMREMVALATRVRPIPCATPLEAEVRELRLIAAHKPRFNRRSRSPERAIWLKLTAEAFPRLSVVRAVRDDGATYLGPCASTGAAQEAMAALHETFRLRQCTDRLSPGRHSPACALAEMGRCGAPCTGAETVDDYARHVEAARAAMLGDVRPVVETLTRRINLLARAERFEEAATARDRLLVFVRAAARTQRLLALTRCPELVAARPHTGGWELVAVRHGRLVGTSRSPRHAAPMPYVDALRASAETVAPGSGPTPAASAEESECVLRWLESPGVRLVHLEGEWTCPAHGAGSVRARLETAAERVPVVPGDETTRHRSKHRRAAPVSRIALA